MLSYSFPNPPYAEYPEPEIPSHAPLGGSSFCYGFVLNTYPANEGLRCTLFTRKLGKFITLGKSSGIRLGQAGDARLYAHPTAPRLVSETLEFPHHLWSMPLQLSLYLSLISLAHEALVPFHPAPRLYDLLHQLSTTPGRPSPQDILKGECLLLEEGGYGHPQDIHQQKDFASPHPVPLCLRHRDTVTESSHDDLLAGFALTGGYLSQTGLVKRFPFYRHQALTLLAR